MKTIYRSVPNKDESEIIEINENEGWKLYQIHEKSIIFKKEIPSHFICVWYVTVEGRRHGPFLSEEKLVDFLSFRLIFTIDAEKHWIDPVILGEESRLDKLVRICVSLPGEELIVKDEEKTWTNPSTYTNRSFLNSIYEHETIEENVIQQQNVAHVPAFNRPSIFNTFANNMNINNINVSSWNFSVEDRNVEGNRITADPIDINWQDIFEAPQVNEREDINYSLDVALQRLEDIMREERERQARLRHDQ
jgi:hypothetical protein